MLSFELCNCRRHHKSVTESTVMCSQTWFCVCFAVLTMLLPACWLGPPAEKAVHHVEGMRAMTSEVAIERPLLHGVSKWHHSPSKA
jgi:hypothetical protein